LFSKITEAKQLKYDNASRWPQEFIFVGRLVHEKNIDGLVSGYLKYREMVDNPWTLRCVGDGPLRHLLENKAGIICDGWLDSEQISKLMSQSGAFLLPSNYEPWGVVVHEACCNGLPLILSTNVGAGSDLLREYYNGISFNATDSMELANALKWVSCHPEPNVLGRNSFIISKMFSTKMWVTTLVTKTKQLLPKN
jgi:glycosyltransferase involved in cell wall biosynthesis